MSISPIALLKVLENGFRCINKGYSKQSRLIEATPLDVSVLGQMYPNIEEVHIVEFDVPYASDDRL